MKTFKKHKTFALTASILIYSAITLAQNFKPKNNSGGQGSIKLDFATDEINVNAIFQNHEISIDDVLTLGIKACQKSLKVLSLFLLII